MSKISREDEIKQVKEMLSDTTHDFEAKLNEVRDEVVNYTKKNPLKTIGFSLLAGVILSQIFRSRK